MNHSLRGTIVSSVPAGEAAPLRKKELDAYCAMVPEGLRPCFRARCTCVVISARERQVIEVERTLLVPRSFPLPGCSFAARAS